MVFPMEEIQQEFLKYAPYYAQEEAKQAIWKIFELQKQGIIRNGLYYIVLTDLVGSTKYGVRNGNEKLADRIKNFILASFDALNEIEIKNSALFIKEIGDAVLFIFQHFPDLLLWSSMFRQYLKVFEINDEPFNIRTCINVGEVFLQGVNPLSIAVSQTFKMEKSVPSNQIVLTETAYSVAWPTVARAYHGFKKVSSIQMDGFIREVDLFQLQIHDDKDLERIAKEKLDTAL
jgi:class 3 adenylate cyclase